MKAFLLSSGLVLVVACGDSTGTGASAGSGGTGAQGGATSQGGESVGPGGNGGAGTGGVGEGGSAASTGDCADDNDCPPDGQCVEIVAGGFTVCRYPVAEATTCTDPNIDQCCDSSECGENQQCYETPIYPSCGGAQMLPHNECAQDICATDPDCEGQAVCVPSGTVGNKVRICLAAYCETNADCGPGAACAPVFEPCCGNAAGLYCGTPGINCRSSADCSGDEYCAVDPEGMEATCQPGGPTCPL